ncbi:MAG: hypothetical protein A2W91_05865 [Bacteroidetes bacterium GWF2_38_335]|nr:MAG: hypothetical protein A2W91_05865 [Bacteroidetes bacterium GWF2_38_335]OFY81602.1 MAG: hypothetical protein A2281_11660 [Bacteroidetes bacterium RIFOXYA12_FULL_38_20]HBS88952.1 hypothetical protein [Bacteroidales bacterium]
MSQNYLIKVYFSCNHFKIRGVLRKKDGKNGSFIFQKSGDSDHSHNGGCDYRVSDICGFYSILKNHMQPFFDYGSLTNVNLEL